MSSLNIEEIKLQAFAGQPSIIDNTTKIKVYPLTISEIIEIGMDKYNSMVGLLTMTAAKIQQLVKDKADENVDLSNIEPLSYLLQSAQFDDNFLLELQNAFHTFLKEDILILPEINSVLVGSPYDKRLITKDNFHIFQTILQIQNAQQAQELPPEDETELEKKFRLLREQRDAVKAKQQKKKGGGSFVSLLEIAEVYGIHWQDKTMYAFYQTLSRFSKKEKWDQDCKSLMLGADPQKVKAQYWGSDEK